MKRKDLLNPITKKRLERFKKMRRAYWSLWLLLGLYLVGLSAEVLCNNKPLYIRFQGKSYFPFLFYYPEDRFTGSGRQTRPDYKAIHQSPGFVNHPENTMVFPLIPFGPNEIIEPSSLDVEKTIQVHIIPQPRNGSVNIRQDFSISRGTAAGYFFDTEDRKVKGLRLTEHWLLDKTLRAGIHTRFANEPALLITTLTTNLSNPKQKIVISLPAYKPRSRAPKTIRLTFRDPKEMMREPEILYFDAVTQQIKKSGNIWRKLSHQEQDTILQAARERTTTMIEDMFLTVESQLLRITFHQEDVHWPYKPIKGHWLGMDSAGRDVLVRILYGIRISLTFGLVLVLFSMTIGVIIGSIQGYYGGKVDIITQRFIEIWSALPFLYIMILMGSIYGRSFSLLLILYGLFNWIGISYYIRGEILKLRRRPFVEAATCMGLPGYKIIFRHILPNSLIPVITFFPFSLVGAIGALTALDYLGFGLPPPTPSWGELLAQAQRIPWAWWLILYPSIILFTVMLLGVFIGEGVREAFDPKPQSKME